MTAEEFLDHISENGKYTFDWKEFGVLFAKYHVERALKAAADAVEINDYVWKSILTSYPLENIK